MTKIEIYQPTVEEKEKIHKDAEKVFQDLWSHGYSMNKILVFAEYLTKKASDNISTNLETKARAMDVCPVCEKEKSEGAIVCWHHFKDSADPLKETNLTVEAWLKKYAKFIK